MSFIKDLEHLCRVGGTRRLPVPPACQQILSQARAEGIAIGEVVMLSRPLYEGVFAGYDLASGDLWCHVESGKHGSQLKVLWSLLTCITALHLRIPHAPTLEEELERIQTIHREAFRLATAWQQKELLQSIHLDTLLTEDATYIRALEAAGRLSGTLYPALARRAYQALQNMQRESQWSQEQFLAALLDEAEQEEANSVVVDFDRTVLRSCWRVNSSQPRNRQENLFGALALPQTTRSASLVRTLLARLVHPDHGLAPKESISGRHGASLTFFEVMDERDLEQVVACVNTWLVTQMPDASVRMWWHLFADDQAGQETPEMHLYHLQVEYQTCIAKDATLTRQEAWILFPAARIEVVEAAWQRYVTSWLTYETIYHDDLQIGLHLLWSSLQPEPALPREGGSAAPAPATPGQLVERKLDNLHDVSLDQ